MTLLYVLGPALLLAAACTGYGLAVMAVFRGRFAWLPIAFRLAAAYFVGQGLLAGLFLFLALFGIFTAAVVVPLVVTGAVLCAIFLWPDRHDIRAGCADASTAWLRAPLSWRFLAILAALLFLCGVFTMGRILEVDATAFYLAAAKLIAHTGRIGTVPGYESFSWVIMTGELFYASLMLLGSPGTGARLYEWINFAPVLVALYSVARLCNLSARAAFLAALMALTSSAVVGLFGGGKVDTFAVGPALTGIGFALASWRSDRRASCIAASGLFCGFAIAAKLSYLIVLLPGAMLLIYWQDICEGFAELKVRAWRALLQRVRRIIVASLPFFALLALGLAPFIIKNLVIFHAPFGPADSLAGGAWFSRQTTLRIVLSYPLALTYGRYWAQLGTLSPLILAFIPLFFLMPRNERKLASPLTAMAISTAIALAIWIAMMPSIFMPRYILATLLLCSIPAAAGAAHASRGRTLLAGIIVSAAMIATVLTPSRLISESAIYYPDEAIDYFRDGMEEKLFRRDAYVASTMEINQAAQPNDRVLLLTYPRLWLRADLLAGVSTMAEVGTAKMLLDRGSDVFWAFVQEKKFRFLMIDAAQTGNVTAIQKLKPAGTGFCEIMRDRDVVAFQIGDSCAACPAGERMTLTGSFRKIWADGNGFEVMLPALEAIADSTAWTTQSRIALCEGEHRLRPAHSLHDEIRTKGGGRFSHWGPLLYFSTSDNSDPNTNGRTYTIVKPR